MRLRLWCPECGGQLWSPEGNDDDDWFCRGCDIWVDPEDALDTRPVTYDDDPRQ